MSAYYARGAISHNGDLIFLSAPADLLDRRVNICRLVISGLIVFRKNDRVFFFPFLTSSDPPVYGFFILCSAVRIELFLVEDELQLLEKSLTSAWTGMSTWTVGFFNSSASISL